MAFELPRNSLFAILLRSRWWVSVLAAAAMFALVRLFLAAGYAVAAALPFLLIGIYAAFQQLRRPGPKRIAATLERARAMPWDDFYSALEEAFRREGYAVTRMEGIADLHLANQGWVTLVACKRWKAMRTGIEPLREFDAATSERGAHHRIYIAAGELTDNARAFAAQKKIRLLHEEELAQLLARVR
ncbi:MAG: restriction endonuclease [Burkholderiales bacterium]